MQFLFFDVLISIRYIGSEKGNSIRAQSNRIMNFISMQTFTTISKNMGQKQSRAQKINECCN